MLTRLEVHGFKNLLGFSVEFGPFNCIAGLNGVGKSNIFDSIKFLSLLADKSIHEAALDVRESASSDPLDIFWTDGSKRISKILMAAEMIVKPDVEDDFGRAGAATSTFLRYEIELGYREELGGSSVPLIYIISERLKYITKGDASSRIKFPCNAKNFRNKAVINNRKSADFISTDVDGDVTVIQVHQDGGSSGHPQKIPADRVPKTVIANTNSVVWPTILSARREMQSWRFLFLEPSSMRRSNKIHDPQKVSSNGGYLASSLYGLYQKDSSVYSRIASRMSDMLPVSDVKIDFDQVRQTLTVLVKERSGAFLPARSLSDGTLRFLALCIMVEDSSLSGLLCFEEPENGVHPAKLESMLELLKDFCVNPDDAVDESNPMRQMIIATHSPFMVSLQDERDLLYADLVKVRGPYGDPAFTIRCKSLKGSWRDEGDYADVLDKASILVYLSYPKNAQIKLI